MIKQWAAVGLDVSLLILFMPFVLIGFMAGLAVVIAHLIAASIKVGYERALRLLENHVKVT